MSKRILITGQNSILSKHLSDIFLQGSGYSVVAAIPGSEQQKKGKGSRTVLWNTRSPLSAKNVVLEAAAPEGIINEAVVLFESPKVLKPFHEISAADIEQSIDYQIKSNLFIIKEILRYFQNSGSESTLSLVNYQGGIDVLPPLEALSSGGFDSFVKALFTFYQNEKLSINGYFCASADLKEYSEFVFKTITERNRPVHGKFYKFPEKNVLSAFGLARKH